MSKHRPVVLIILDGFGYREEREHNAIAMANTPNWDKWWQSCPHGLIDGSGASVGLPAGQMGNSEVGHMHLGAGRTLAQDFTRINDSIDSGEFINNPVFVNAIKTAKENNKNIHVLGLVSDGGVHSHVNHINAFIDTAKAHDMNDVIVHAFLDGRDCPPKSAKTHLDKLTEHMDAQQCGQVGSITGRYFAMDRDKRWDRVERFYDLLTSSIAPFQADSAQAALDAAYTRGETDEFVQPTHVNNSPTFNDGDVLVFMNFRSDRARQLCHALLDDDFDGFQRKHHPVPAQLVTLTQYAKDIDSKIAFAPMRVKNNFADILAKHNKTQLRIAETEKYAHVTFFFNSGIEEPYPGEERLLIPSPKVATYDLAPEMNAPLLTDKLIEAIESEKFDAIICNYANPDMVGHTGNIPATIKAIECIDHCLGRLHKSLTAVNGEMLITADHGNAESMFNAQTNQAHTAHTSEPVPLLYLGQSATMNAQNASLKDIAPTLLYLMGLDIPAEMTGRSLIETTGA